MSPAGITALLALTLALALAGLWTLQRGWAERGALTDRTERGFSERQPVRWRVRVDRALRRTPPGRALARRLAQAGLRAGVLETILLAAGGMLTVAVVVGAPFGRVTGLLAAAAALAGGNAWLNSRQRRRQELLVAQLPEVARVLSNALSAGLAMPAALAMVTDELADPAAVEFRQVVHALRIGRPVDAALNELAERLPSREVGVLVTTLVVQQRAGGDLVDALRTISDTLETRKDLRQEIRTATAGSVATTYAVVGLVVATLVVLNLIDPGVLDQLTGTLIGRAVVAVAVALYALGFLLIGRIIRIEV